MMDPVTALLVAIVGLGAVGYALLARRGLVARLRRARMDRKRVLIEDALKHVYDCEYRKLICTQRSIAGTLGISGDEAAGLVLHLGSLGLIKVHGEGLQLTDDGRSYALRIIRIHRLWERYLADETGMKETDWHGEAEQAEHVMTLDETNALSARLGDPRYDPHGDPIPTPNGDLPTPRGYPLTQLAPGEQGQIVHIEDEPDVIYAQLVAAGLCPGVRVQLLDKSNDRVRFVADNREHVLAPVVASNVTVVPLKLEVPEEVSHDSLAQLEPGETARVAGISRACRGQQRRRLMDLGILPGTLVTAEMRSASGDPTAYSVRGAMIALRTNQARLVYVDRKERKEA
jgi:DtxR family Mn-dependent transcriptional regulator